VFEIGKSIHDARMRRGLDIADCERETKIRGKYLRALEEEEFGMLPDPAYVKGFLRAYGAFLDVDPQLLLDEYVSRFEPAPDNNHEVHPVPQRPPRATRRSARMPELSSAPRAPRRARRRTGLPLLALAVGAAVAVGIIVWLGSTGSGSSAGDGRDLVGAPAPASSTVRLAVTGVGGGSSLEVRRSGATGAVLYRGTVRDGQRQTFAGARRLWVRVGSGANVRVLVDGRPVAPRGGQAYTVSGEGLLPA
jgi:Helix-turn-helix domain/RodZ C-terminal domain